MNGGDMNDMNQDRGNKEEDLCECDPGRTLLHASFYVWKQAGHFLLPAWLDAQEILRQARNEYDDQDRIDFVHRIDQQLEEIASVVRP